MKTRITRTETETDYLSEKESIYTIRKPSEDSFEESDDDKEEATVNVGAKNGILKNNQKSCNKTVTQKMNLRKKRKRKMRFRRGSCQNRRLDRKLAQEGNLGLRRRLDPH